MSLDIDFPEKNDQPLLDSEKPFEVVDVGKRWTAAGHLSSANMPAFFGEAREKAAKLGVKNPDFMKMDVAMVGKIIATASPNAVKFLFSKDANKKLRAGSIAGLEAKVFGGDGILTTTYAEEMKNSPLAKKIGANSVGNRFDQGNLRHDDFQKDLNSRGKDIINTLILNPESKMDDVITEKRVNYLASLFLSAKTKEDIEKFNTLWKHTEKVFGSLLSLSLVANLPGVNDENMLNIPFLTKSLGESKKFADGIILKEIENRMSSEEMSFDLLSEMINTTLTELANSGTPFDKMSAEEAEKVIGDIGSNFYQVLFASLETTKAGILFTHKALSDDLEKQDKLRNLVHAFVENKKDSNGNWRVDFTDLVSKKTGEEGKSESPFLADLIEFAVETIVENIITPITARDVDSDIYLQDKNGGSVVLEEGYQIFIDLAGAAREQLAEMKANRERIDNINSAVKLLIFGDGFSKCKGAHFAIYEIVNQLVQTLYHTTHFAVTDSTYRPGATNLLQGVETHIEVAEI